jgi:glycerol-3-phosphate acyltransferase PlsX
LIRATDLNFIGNVEGTDVYTGRVDVIVCDGFVGNVALKSSEGIARLMTQMLREEFTRTTLSKLSAVAANGVLQRFKARLDPSTHNGATLLGLRGIVVKSHGGAEAAGFAIAIDRAYNEATHNLIAGLTERLAAQHAKASTATEN